MTRTVTEAHPGWRIGEPITKTFTCAATKNRATSTHPSIWRSATSDRFSLAIDVIDRVPSLRVAGAHVKEQLRNMQIECQSYACELGVDKPEVDQWTWPS